MKDVNYTYGGDDFTIYTNTPCYHRCQDLTCLMALYICVYIYTYAHTHTHTYISHFLYPFIHHWKPRLLSKPSSCAQHTVKSRKLKSQSFGAEKGILQDSWKMILQKKH